MAVTYDPPSGWLHGFPRAYEPRVEETLIDTLIRDGYPKQHAEFAAKHCSFSGSQDELDALFPRNVAAEVIIAREALDLRLNAIQGRISDEALHLEVEVILATSGSDLSAIATRARAIILLIEHVSDIALRKAESL